MFAIRFQVSEDASKRWSHPRRVQDEAKCADTAPFVEHKSLMVVHQWNHLSDIFAIFCRHFFLLLLSAVCVQWGRLQQSTRSTLCLFRRCSIFSIIRSVPIVRRHPLSSLSSTHFDIVPLNGETDRLVEHFSSLFVCLSYYTLA